MKNGFSFDRIIILSSLESDETDTAKALYDFIESEKTSNQMSFKTILTPLENANEMRQMLKNIATDASSGALPLIQIECHGDISEGLEFKNGSTLPWDELEKLLLPINIATRFNLLVGIAACFGGHFIGRMSPTDPCPCWAIVAPAKQVDPGEVMSGFRKFYGTLLRTKSVNKAQSALATAEGTWFLNNAEQWYLDITKNYLKTYSNRKIKRDRIAEFHKMLKINGQERSMSSIKKDFIELNKKDLLEIFFNRYFITDLIPENAARFGSLKRRIEFQLEDLKKNGNQWV